MPQSLLFLPCPSGQLLVQQFLPHRTDPQKVDPQKIVLIVPPFAEELNRSRRMLALLGRALADAGVTAILPDLYGTGDSEGRFSDATWPLWTTNLREVGEFVEREYGAITEIVAVRLGARLALTLLDSHSVPVYCWQPLLDGRSYLKQFARAQMMAEKLAGNNLSFADIEQQFVAGDTVELSGYQMSASLGQDLLGMADVQSANLGGATVVSFETLRDAEANISLGRSKIHTQLTEAGAVLEIATVIGESFWQTTETTENLSLVDMTVNAIVNQGPNK